MKHYIELTSTDEQDKTEDPQPIMARLEVKDQTPNGAEEKAKIAILKKFAKDGAMTKYDLNRHIHNHKEQMSCKIEKIEE